MFSNFQQVFPFFAKRCIFEKLLTNSKNNFDHFLKMKILSLPFFLIWCAILFKIGPIHNDEVCKFLKVTRACCSSFRGSRRAAVNFQFYLNRVWVLRLLDLEFIEVPLFYLDLFRTQYWRLSGSKGLNIKNDFWIWLKILQTIDIPVGLNK